MHTISISLQGAANDSVTIEVADSEALPIYVKLKEVIAAPSDGRKKGRRRAKTDSADQKVRELAAEGLDGDPDRVEM